MQEIEILLLDIEGTTTPKAFVYDTLFPYAREHFLEFLQRQFDDPGIREDVALLRKECGEDPIGSAPRGDQIAAAHRCAMLLMEEDRKSTGLKALQGKIWEEGFRAGALTGTVYPDVPPAFERWSKQGKRICIYSSGSIQAQKLLFSHTGFGNLTRYFFRHFDTTTGPKIKRESYLKIARALGAQPGSILFVSDSVSELGAADSAEMETRWCIRDEENPPDVSFPFAIVRSFNEIFP